MNKIIVSQKELKLENTIVGITEFQEKDCLFHILGDVTIGLFTIPRCLHLKLVLHESAHLLLEYRGVLVNHNLNIEIVEDQNSSVDCHLAFAFKKENEVTIQNIANSSCTHTNILVRTIEKGGNLVLKAEGIIKEKTVDNIYLEDIKALTNHANRIKIMPNLLVKTNSVTAKHNTTISPLQMDELFYLLSKGLSQESSVKLIENGFLTSILKIDAIKTGEVMYNES